MDNASRTVFGAFDGSVDARLVEAALPSPTTLRTASLSDGVENIMVALDEARPEIVLVGCSGHSAVALSVIEKARQRPANCVVVVLYTGSPNGFMEHAFGAGADDLIVLPQSPQSLEFALQKAVARHRRKTTDAAPLGSIICIVGPKGGTGKTVTATNLGVALALGGKKSVIVDIDLQFGDVGIALGLTPDRTIYDLAVSGDSQDRVGIEHFLVEHRSGARAMLAPTRPDQADAITVELIRAVLGNLRVGHDFVIIDTPPAFSPEVITAIDEATDLCVVGMLDALSLKDTKIGLETLGLMGYARETVKLVLNRADTNVGISQDDVAALLGRRPDILVPSDRAIPRAITDGLPIVMADERSGPARAYTKLAALYLKEQRELRAGDLAVSTGPTGRRALFTRKGRS